MINKDCSFSKFNDLLGIQQVVFNSVLNGESLAQSVDNVKEEYLKKYYGNDLSRIGSTNEEIRAFLGDVANAIHSATMDEDGEMLFDDLDEKEAAKVITERVSAWADALYKTDEVGTNLETRTEDESIDSTGTSGALNTPLPVNSTLIANQIEEPLNFAIESVKNLRDLKHNYFKSASIAQSQLQRNMFNDFFKASFVDLSKPTTDDFTPSPVTTARELDKNMKDYKSELFQRLFPGEQLYVDGVSIPNLDTKLREFERTLAELNGGDGVYVQDLIRWLYSDTAKIKQYYALIGLKHFDDLVKMYGAGLVAVKPNLIGNYSETYDDVKYIPAHIGKMRTSWTEDEMVSIIQETTPLFRTIIETTNVINLEGNKTRGFLRPDQVYFAMSKLKNKINKDDVTNSIRQAVVESLEDYFSGASKLLNTGDVKVLLSLYQRIFSDKNSNYQLKKNRDMRPIITNLEQLQESSLAQVYHSHFSVASNLNLLDVVAAHVSKIDLMNYGEVSLDYATREFKTYSLQNKLRDQNFSILKALGRQSRNATQHTLENWSQNYGISIDDDTVTFKLDESSIVYNPIEQTITDQNGETIDFSKIAMPVDMVDMNVVEMSDNFADYRKILDMFSSIASQPLNSLNYEIPQILRDNYGANHIKDLVVMAGNLAYVSYLKVNHLQGLDEMTKADVQKNLKNVYGLLKKFPFNRLWNPAGYFNIDFGDTSYQAIRNYADVLNEVHGTNIRSTTLNAAGKATPTYTLSRMINDLRSVVNLIRKGNPNTIKPGKDYSIPLADNIFVTNTTDDLLKKVEIRLTLKDALGNVIPSSKLTDVETVMYDIFNDYAEQKLHPDEMERNPKFQATNYADKSQHAAIVMNGDAYLNINGETKKYRDLTTNEFKDHFFFTQKSYYNNLWSTIMDDYVDLFRSGTLFQSYLNNSTVLKEAINAMKAADPNYVLEGAIDFNSLPLEFVGDVLSKEVGVYNDLHYEYQNSRPSYSDSEINEILGKVSEKVLSSALADAGISNVKTILYEIDPKTKSPVVNKTITFFNQAYGSGRKAYETRIKRSFLKGLDAVGFTLDYLNNVSFTNNVTVEKMAKQWSMSAFKDETLGRYKLYTGDLNSNFTMNPMLEQYLWERNMATENFQNATVGSIVGHPHKTKAGASNEEMISARTVAMFKRMVIHQATFHPYTLNLINGIPFFGKVAFIKDPTSQVFSPFGIRSSVDVTDGATYNLPLLTRLQNNSLLDQSAGVTQKSIGGGLDRKYNSAELLKHAAHSITNERLRNENADSKYSYMGLVRKGLQHSFNVSGIPVKMDISKDYNGNEIVLNDIGQFDDVSFFNEETNQFLSVHRIIPAPGTWLSNNEYHAIYKDMMTGQILDPQTIKIDNLYDLWQALGGKNSISFNADEPNANLNGSSNLKGYVWSDKSWDALAEYVNRVGVWYNDDAIGKIMPDTSFVSAADLKEAHNSRVINPKSITQNFDSTNSSPTQKTIIQPLKQSFIGQFTFSSGQKVGVQNENSTDILNRGNTKPLAYAGFISNLHTGIQLNADHETDDSIVTEPTQITNTLNFNGDTPEYAEAAYKAIYRYIDNSLSKVLPDIDKILVLPEAKYRVYSVIANEILKNLDGDDTGTMSGAILSAVEIELDKYKSDLRLLAKANPTSEAYTNALMKVGDYDDTGFKIPFSDSNIYGTFSTTIANFFTKEGIRRKLPGMAAVISPYSGFFGMRTVTDLDGQTMVVNEEGYRQWRRNMEERVPLDSTSTFAQLHEETPINALNKHTIEIFDTVRDANGKVTYLDTPDKYYAFKTSTEDFTHLKTASRDLKPTMHKWSVKGIEGSFNYYDLSISKLSFINGALETEYKKLMDMTKGKLKGTIDDRGQSVFEIETAGSRSRNAINQFAKVRAMVRQQNDLIKMSSLDGDLYLHTFEPVITDYGDNGMSFSVAAPNSFEFTDNEKRMLKNELSQVLNSVHGKRLAPLPITTLTNAESLIQYDIVKDQENRQITMNAFDAFNLYKETNPLATVAEWMRDEQPLVHIEKFETVPGEILMPAVNKTKYGLSANDQVQDVNERFFFDRISKLSLPDPSVPHDFYVQASNGEHLYVLLKDSEDFRNAVLKEAKIDSVIIPQKDGSNKTFKVDPEGNTTYEMGYDTLYQSMIGGKIRNYVVVNDLDALKHLSVISKGKNSPYDKIVPNFSAGLRTASVGVQYMLDTKARFAQKYASQLEKIQKNFSVKGLDTNEQKLKTTSEATGTELLGMYDAEWAQSELDSINKRIAYLKTQNQNSEELKRAERKAAKVSDYLSMVEEYQAMSDEDEKNLYGQAVVETAEFFKHRDIMSANNAIQKITDTLQKNTDAISAAFKAMNRFQYSNMSNDNRRKAKELNSSFKVQLNVTAARIPGQHMQSYMGQKIVGFVHTEGSLAFVSPFHMWITGEDFDIDKVFITQYSVDDSGKLIGWGKMFNYDTPETLRKSLELPLPDGDVREFTDKAFLTSAVLTAEDGQAIERYLDSKLGFNDYVKAMKKFGNAKTIYVAPYNPTAIDYSDELVKKHIQSYFLEEINDRYPKEATLNVLVNSINGSINDIRNVNAQYSPVDFGKAGDAASKSSKGAAFKQMSPLNPVDIARAKNASMIGKEVIGISATGLKVYSALSNALVKIKERGADTGVMFATKIADFSKDEKGAITKTNERPFAGIAGINYTNNVDEYLAYYQKALKSIRVEVHPDDLVQVRANIVRELRYREDVALDLSALLSAATDNAKELILGRINAGPETVSFYVTGLMYGYDFASLANLMTSREAEAMLALAGRNVYSGKRGSISKALTQLTAGYLDPREYMDFKAASVIVDQLRTNPEIHDALVKKYTKQYVDTVFKNPFRYIEGAAKLDLLKFADNIQNTNKIEGIYSIERVRPPQRLNAEDQETADMLANDYLADLADAADDTSEVPFDVQDEVSEYDEYAQYMAEQAMDAEQGGGNFRPKVDPIIWGAIAFQRYMTANAELIPTVDKETLEYLSQFNDMSSDVKVLGQMLSINQSIKVTDFDLYKYFKNIALHTSANVNPERNKGKKASYISKYGIPLTTIEDFNDFVSDADFRQRVIDSHAGIGLNTLAVLVESDHFFKMFQLGVKTDVLKNQFSSKNKLIRSMVDDVADITKENRVLSYKEFGIISNFANDVIINNFLDGAKFDFQIKKGDFSTSDEPSAADKVVVIDSMHSQLEYVNWFEKTLIPDLKSGKVRDDSNNYYNLPIIGVRENLFLQLLTVDTKKDITANQTYSFLKLPINMNGTLTEDEKVRMDDIITAFSTLRNYSYGGKKLLDLLYLYNLIVNKNKNTAQSFNRLFDSVSEGFNNQSLMTDFIKFESKLDWQGVSLQNNKQYKIDDLLTKGMVKVSETLPLIDGDGEGQPDYVAIDGWNDTTKEKERKIYAKVNGAYTLLEPPRFNNKIINIHNGYENLNNLMVDKNMQLKQQRLLTFLEQIELERLDCK